MSALIRNLIKLKGTTKLTVQDERVCLKDSKYSLFEILANRTWKGCTSSCRPSQPNCQIVLARLVGAYTALYLLFSRISNKMYLESLRHTRSSCAVSFAVPFNFTRFLISTLWSIWLLEAILSWRLWYLQWGQLGNETNHRQENVGIGRTQKLFKYHGWLSKVIPEIT